MNSKDAVRPITDLKNRTAELVRDVVETGRTVTITQNGRAKVVVMDVELYDRWQNAMALLKILTHAEADIRAGRTVSQEAAFARATARIKAAARDA